jgi:hypothetical protein
LSNPLEMALFTKRAVHDGPITKHTSNGDPSGRLKEDMVEKVGFEDLDGSAATNEDGKTRRRSSSANERFE